ncbi:MAG: preprotein translocase subunit SecA [Myxococcales bacterium]|nr:preprotein translocase subunit SecA [Myxococcales bacterium]
MFGWALKKILGTKHQRELKKLQPMVAAINELEPKLAKLSDEALQRKTQEFREKLDNGAPLDDLLVPAFATVREAGKRVLGMRHYDVQLIGGIVLHQGRIAEMRTGEGKTLVATLPCYLNALSGKGVHVVTVNDYLARRDAEWMGRLHNFLGLEVGVIVPQTSNAQKKRAYQADITYGQNNEYGFDYLRDNMKFSIYEYVQRELNYAIVDEVDSILIDEARTPLIISGPGETASEKYKLVTEVIPKLRRDEHYEVDEKARSVNLTEFGMERAQELLQQKGLLIAPKERKGSPYRGEEARGNLYDPVNLETLHILQQCLRAHALYHRDQHYMVSPDGKVMIIDEFRGRVLAGRRWSDGLHQAVEAKEQVPIQDESITLATISFQNLFRLYDKLSGMTGTADTEATEFHKIYELDVSVIPTNKPIQRVDAEDLVYKTEREKFVAVADEIAEVHEAGRPVLVGTTSVEKSQALSQLLAKRGIRHSVLNAKEHDREAEIVAQAGTRNAVTVSTNMAGRGTDIVLGGNAEMLARMEVMANATEELLADPAALERAVEEATKRLEPLCKEEGKAIKELGGLHIVGTERHESRRIDNQLRGRAGRQGDPGSSRFFLSLEDDLMRIFMGDRIQGMMDRLGMQEGEPIEHPWVSKAVENAQKKVEERNFDIRKHLLEYDDVMNQQRKSIYELRKQVLQGQYRTTPTDEEKKKGARSEPIVTVVDEALRKRAKPILEQMIKLHGTEPPPAGASNEEIQAFRERAFNRPVAEITEVRAAPLERDVYMWFGCVFEAGKLAKRPKELLAKLEEEVSMSLTEQKERMLDMTDELVSSLVERYCPPGKHHEDWDWDGIEEAFEEQFDSGDDAEPFLAPDLRDKVGDAQELAQRYYTDAENVLLKKMNEIGAENYLRLFRNAYLEEIDRRWIEHLQDMERLRDGIGLRGYGQRDPKKEYQREGFSMFMEMVRGIKSNVSKSLFSVRRVREEDLQALEAQRRQASEQRQQQMRTQHAAASATGEPGAQPVPRGVRVAPAGTLRAQGRPMPQQGGSLPPGAAPQPQQPQQPMNRHERRALEKKQKKSKRPDASVNK